MDALTPFYVVERFGASRWACSNVSEPSVPARVSGHARTLPQARSQTPL
jgi:hypothetical protein